MNKTIYSIIIPHRNSVDLLSRLLSTIPVREDTEIIIVDDNSDSTLVNFEEFPGSERLDVKTIFTKEGKGAGYARNVGLKEAIGDWLYFADADDMFTDKITYLFDKYKSISDVDMVFVNALTFDESNKTHEFLINRFIDNYFKKRYRALDVLRFQIWTPWSRMIRREIFIRNNISFEEVPTANDVMGILLASKYSKTFTVERDVVYLYYKPTTGSITDKLYNDNTALQRLNQKFRINELYKKAGYPILWPINLCIPKSKSPKTQTHVKQILKDNNYNAFIDYCILCNFAWFKLLKII